MTNRLISAAEREILPIPHRPYVGPLPYDAKDPEAKFPPIVAIRPPAGAPNILIVLLDDVGFGATSAFGGPCRTKTAERLAANGLKYTRFHTAALCSPTRSALLTGRNHHSVGMGTITETATAAPGYTSIIPNTAANVGKILKYNGYSTGYFGKCHEIPTWETSPVGPFDHWPTHNGFEKFYGFIGGETNQWFPNAYEGTRRVTTPDDPEYHFMADMTDQAIAWIRTQKTLAPDKPFFAYFAPGATHAPHHVPKAWADKYSGEFGDGWDALRERSIAAQKEIGVIPHDALLTVRPTEIPSWNDMPKQLLPVLARQMEVYAGFLEYTDHHIGRLIQSIEELGVLDDTLILYILGDNGASAEGTLQGTFNEMINFNGLGALETPEFLEAHREELGGRSSYNHYAVGWAHALDAPYPWTKQVASHWGGTRNGMIVHWPAMIDAKGETRAQFHHVVDVLPTILEAAGLPMPVMVEGIQQQPIEGVSLVYSLNDADAPERHVLQYFEMFGNRGIYLRGWAAVTKHRTPWELVGAKMPAFDDDKWELYDVTRDWTEAEDLAQQFPDKLHELQRVFLIEAARHQVLPLDDRTVERIAAAASTMPQLVHGSSQLLFEGMELEWHAVIDVKNRSFTITAEIDTPALGARGVIFAKGTNFGGYALYAPEGRLKFVYNFLGLGNYAIEAPDALPSGKHEVRLEFVYDGGGLGKGGMASLLIDSEKVAEGRIEQTVPVIFSADASAMVGDKRGAPIAPDIAVEGNRFQGHIGWVRIDVAPETAGEVPPEHLLRIAMATQ